MKIDVFCHFLPPKYLEARSKKATGGWAITRGALWARTLPAIVDLEARFRIMDRYEDYFQVLSIAAPPVEKVVKPEDAVELSKIANDELAELVLKYPDRFVAAVACLPMNHVDAALDEIDRAMKDLAFRGIQMATDINGKPIDCPEFMPIYEKMAYYDLPILLHPEQEKTSPDYKGEDISKYQIWVRIGWPHATSLAMIRLSGSGILEKYPTLKFVTHHAGGTIPFLQARIQAQGDAQEMRFGDRYEVHLTKKITDYLRMFYCDTAVCGDTLPLMCARGFFGIEHLLFATDMPFDVQGGLRLVRETIRSVDDMDIPEAERKMIYFDNAMKLFRLPV
jgi:predicted TIM-barrel fold metal-dependent hydrolase